MTKKGQPMDIWFQRYNIPRIITELGEDWSYHIDPKLTLPENIWLIRNKWREFVW